MTDIMDRIVEMLLEAEEFAASSGEEVETLRRQVAYFEGKVDALEMVMDLLENPPEDTQNEQC